MIVFLMVLLACFVSHGQNDALDMPIGLPQPEPEVVEDEDGPTIYDEEISTRSDSIIYVLDKSGSMAWDMRAYTELDGSTQYGDRMDRAKVELIKSIRALSREFMFNVFAFECGPIWWSLEMRRAEPSEKASAIAWIRAITPDGATGTGRAVAQALLEKSNFTIVLLSDGAPNCPDYNPSHPGYDAAQHLRMIQAANTQDAVIHCFGIACYGEFEAFMRAVASTSGGRYVPVP
jgi:hypothetical protein